MSQDKEKPLDTMAGQLAIACRKCLSTDGKAVGDLPAFARDPAELVALYRALVLTRVFDEKAVALQRTGRLGTFASSLGQEAVGVGVARAMRAEDVFVPSFREQGGQLVRGVTPEELLSYWGGDERGSDFAGPREDFPVSIPVGSHVPHAVGVALAFQMRGEARVAVCVFGDGATSKRAGGLRRQQQPVGNLRAARQADGGGDAGAEGVERRHSVRAGRRQRRHRGADGFIRSDRAGAGGWRADAHRGADVPAGGSHDSG
jgi:hypothetical protein